MLAIKLKRVGKKHQGSFRIVVAEKRSKMVGRFTDDLGWWNPRTDKFEVAKEKTLYWIKKGAQPTPTVHNLLITAGVLSGKKIPVHHKPSTAETTGEGAAESKKSAAGEMAPAAPHEAAAA